MNSKRNQWKYIIAHFTVLSILFLTTLIRFQSVQDDMLVSPVLFFITALLYQRKFPLSRIYLFPLLIFSYYTIVVFIEYALSGFKSFEFFSVGFLHFICWLLGAALGQFMANSANKIINGLLLLAFFFLLIFNKYFGVNYWVEILNESNNADIKHVENVMVEGSDGKTYPLDSLIQNSKYTLIECWFQQCRPCWVNLDEINRFMQQKDTFTNKEFSVITLNLRTKNDKTRADSALMQRNIFLPVYYLKEEDVNRFGITSYPTLLIYKDGKLIGKPGSFSNALSLLK